IYAVGEGTSLGAAHVAGVAALMVGKGGFGTNAAVVDRLIASGEKLGSSKLLDAAAALGAKIEAPIVPSPPPGGGTSSPPPLVVSGPGGTSSSPTPGKTTKPTQPATSATKAKPAGGASAPAGSQAPPAGGATS